MAGLFIGQAIHQALPASKNPETQEKRRRLFLGTSVLGSNFPDLDLVLTPLLAEPLGYLLHHRGHTHTFLYLLPQILLLAAVLLLLPGLRRLLKSDSLVLKGWLYSLAISFVLHIACDFLNSYGVHPFHPVNSDWFYGDAVFIIEPVFWVTLGFAFGMTLEDRWRRLIFSGALIALPLLLMGLNLLTLFTGAVLISMAALVTLASRKSSASGLLAGFILWVGFIGLQFYSSNRAYQRVQTELQGKASNEKVYDVILTPLPSNPACWIFISVSATSDNEYMLKKGRLSVYPSFVSVDQCRWVQPMNITSSEGQFQWQGVELNSTSRLQTKAKENCHFNAWLRFARAPSFQGNYVTDQRFSGLQDYNFTTMMWTESECKGSIPEWGYPRADLIFGATM